MKATEEQQEAAEKSGELQGKEWPWGEICPSCNRPHLFAYCNGMKICGKCGALVQS